MNFFGTNGNDSFAGTSGDDNIHGLDGHDSLSGGDGNDYIEGGLGNDIITGGPGSYDQASWMDAINAVHIDLLGGVATGWGNDTVTGIESVLATDYDDTIRGASGAEYIYAWDGDDTVEGGGGDDEINGGTGNDTLRGEGGQDRLWGREGDDILDGGDGTHDAAMYLSSASGVVVDLAAGTASDGEGGDDILLGVEQVYGGSHADSILGSAGGNFLSGGMGNDTLEGGAGEDGLVGGGGDDSLDGGDGGDYLLGDEGDDTLIGGQGVDLAQYSFDPAPVTVNLHLGTAVDGHGGDDVLIGIEHVFGSAYGDFLHGDAGDNVIFGENGDDTIWGGGGYDVLHGDDGDDLAGFLGEFADYEVGVRHDGGIEVVGSEGTFVLYDFERLQFGALVLDVTEGTEEPDELEGTDDDDVIRGRGGDDRLEGKGGDDLLDGGEGADTMEGGEGNDTYIVDDAGDRVIEPDSIEDEPEDGAPRQVGVGGGIDRVVASINYTLGNAVEHLELDTGAAQGTGNALPNIITGNGSDNRLTGGGGNDTLEGGEGIDTAAYAGARSQYAVGASSVDGTAAGEGVDSLSGIERLDFSDLDLALDLDGHAGEVAKVIGAVFGQAVVSNEVYAGIGIRLADQGTSYEALMELALDVVLGPARTNADVVTLLYTNVVGGAPDAGTRDYFVGWIEGGGYTQVTLAMLAADVMGVPAAAQGGLAYQ